MGRAVNVFGGETVPQPLVKELGHDDAWEEWSRAVQQQEVGFAPTAPASLDFARTEPASLEQLRAPAAANAARAAPAVTLDRVMAEVRRNARVCPQPAEWMKLYVLLASHCPSESRMPPQPLAGDVWKVTPVAAKRMCFIEQIEWAARHGCLQAVFDMLQALGDDQWYCAG